MVSPLPKLRTLRWDLAAGLVAWLGFDIMAHPARLVAAVGDPPLSLSFAFELGITLAFVASAFLALRWTVRLARIGRRMAWSSELRATQGTVMAEFVLVLPIVLLLIGTVIQVALIAQAAVVLRYASFVAARSAMVSFEAETKNDLGANLGQGLLALLQIPPFPEWVDRERPERAAHMVLAALSPRASGAHPEGGPMERLLEAQSAAWGGGHFARRMAYAQSATQLQTIRGKHGGGLGGAMAAWHDSWSPLIPLPEHAVQPARQMASTQDIGYLLPEPPSLASLVPDSIPVPIEIPVPEPFDMVIPPFKTEIDIPLPRAWLAPAAASLDGGVNALRTGSARAIRTYARSKANVDPLSPKEVEITLVYDFKLAVPSLLQLAPGVTRPAPDGSGRAFRLKHADFFTVRLQSTGGRRTLLGLFPVVPDAFGSLHSIGGWSFETVPNTPLYWRNREKSKDDDGDGDEAHDLRKRLKDALDKKDEMEKEEEKNKKKKKKKKGKDKGDSKGDGGTGD